MAYLEEQSEALDFTLSDMDGNEIRLSSLRGRRVVLYFYPKDNTPGCTTQACAFEKLQPEFARHHTVIIGVSADGQASHQKFAQKYNLNFTLLSDEDHKVLESYGAWQQKNMYGRISMGTVRTTYVIDENGRIVKLFKRARAATNAADCLAFIAALDKS